MALILAIEPDRRQANHLNAMVRGRLKAELVLADSAERALAALGDRVPDLILTSALLSPRDEAALADRLRTLDAAAAHVRTLTIPVLASPRPRTSSLSRGGVLSALIGDRPQAPLLEGCDPAVFAEQCAAYLGRAAAERALRVGIAEEDEHECPSAVEPPVVTVAQPLRAAEVTVVESSAATAVQPFSAAEGFLEKIMALPPDLDAAMELVVVDESDGVQEPAVEEDLEDRVIELDLSTLVEDEQAIIREFGVPNDPIATIAAAVLAVEADEQRAVVSEPLVPEPDVPEPAVDTPPALVQPLSVGREAPVEREVWIPARLGVRALWPPMESYVAERAAPHLSAGSADPPAAQEPGAKAPVTSMPAPGRRRSKAKPIEDEWGFFDPERCGFAALLAKLEEISEGGDEIPTERPA